MSLFLIAYVKIRPHTSATSRAVFVDFLASAHIRRLRMVTYADIRRLTYADIRRLATSRTFFIDFLAPVPLHLFLTPAAIDWRIAGIRTYAHVCWPMLAYAGLC
jgi:hypothetical protein